MDSREARCRTGNHERHSFNSAAAFLLRVFRPQTEQVNLHIKGFPSSNGDVKLSRRTRGAVFLVTHIKRAFLWTGCLERSGSWDSGEWRGILLFKKTEGGKSKTESHYRGLPVWGADLRVNLFSCLTS